MSKYFDGDKLNGYEDSPVTCVTGYNDLVFRPQNGTIIDPNKIVDNGTAIHLTCDNCGREIFGCTFVNGMKFCAKCYQEIFGETNKDNQITELQKQLEEKEKDNQFLKKMYLSEKQKNDNYHTEKYGLDKPVEELRKIKLNTKEKEIYYKGFDNCERQFATHIAELQQQLKSQPAEIVEKIKEFCLTNHKFKIDEIYLRDDDGQTIYSFLDDILKEYQK